MWAILGVIAAIFALGGCADILKHRERRWREVTKRRRMKQKEREARRRFAEKGWKKAKKELGL